MWQSDMTPTLTCPSWAALQSKRTLAYMLAAPAQCCTLNSAVPASFAFVAASMRSTVDISSGVFSRGVADTSSTCKRTHTSRKSAKNSSHNTCSAVLQQECFHYVRQTLV